MIKHRLIATSGASIAALALAVSVAGGRDGRR